MPFEGLRGFVFAQYLLRKDEKNFSHVSIVNSFQLRNSRTQPPR